MKAVRIHQFGPPDVLVIDEIPIPAPKNGEVLIRTAAAGVGPWDALIREHNSVVDLALPIVLGSDLAGIVESVGPGVSQFKPGDTVYGVTNKNFCGAYAEFAVASANMIATKPASLNFIEAASAPVVAVTAWQMLFDYAQLKSGQSVLIHGGAGNVGGYAVQLAKNAGLEIFATAGAGDLDYVRGLGAQTVIDYRGVRFEDAVPRVDAVIDMVGGDPRERSFNVLKTNGIVVSVASPFPKEPSPPPEYRHAFFLVEVTWARLQHLTELFDGGRLKTKVGSVAPLAQARQTHEMLAGAPHKRGKIVLDVSTNTW